MQRFTLFIIFLSSCNLASLDTKKSGMHKNSQSIEESKNNGVFRFLLNVNKPILFIGNKLSDTIREIWVEDMWMYIENGGILKDSTTEQLLILFGNSSMIYNDKLLLRHRKDYFGWNGVFYDSYSNPRDTIYIISTVTGSEKIVDTILVSK
jgi:hypothetical protein